MPTGDPPPGYNFEFPHLNRQPYGGYGDPNPALPMTGPAGPPGCTGATGPPGPMPSEESVREHVRKQTRYVVLDLLAGADLEWIKPMVREIIREELKKAGVPVKE
jgi:hypothetical protein